LIEIEKVSFKYSGSSDYALRDVNLSIDRASITAIVGRNGAGKSTLLRLLNGLIPHFYEGEFKGRVLVDGVDTREKDISDLSRKVGLVFQNPEHMFFSETVWDEVIFGPKALGRNDFEELGEKALRLTGLVDMKEYPPWSLSGGEMKRLSVACILSMETDYIALDEPTVGQDAVSRKELIDILRSLKEMGRGIIVVSHDLEWISDLRPDRVIVIRDGYIFADGGPDILADTVTLARAGLVPPISSIIGRAIGVKGLGIDEILKEVLG
jgi:energy-coupling factor transporter ATP-binding protein EcfA2